jgi:hypothetical protein
MEQPPNQNPVDSGGREPWIRPSVARLKVSLEGLACNEHCRRFVVTTDGRTIWSGGKAGAA